MMLEDELEKSEQDFSYVNEKIKNLTKKSSSIKALLMKNLKM
jgi:hypothetical protein